jgi:hypothetical protein
MGAGQGIGYRMFAVRITGKKFWLLSATMASIPR